MISFSFFILLQYFWRCRFYPEANLTIPLLITSLTAQIPWTVYWRSRKIMKHCLPVKKIRKQDHNHRTTQEKNIIHLVWLPVPRVVWRRARTNTLLPTESTVKSFTLVQTLAMNENTFFFFHEIIQLFFCHCIYVTTYCTYETYWNYGVPK